MRLILAVLLVLLISLSLAYLLLARKYRQLKAASDVLVEDNMKVRSDMKSAIYKIKMYEELINRLTSH